MAPIPSLLSVAAVHHHLVRDRTRTKVGLVVEAGDAREVHHMAALVGLRRRRDQPVHGVRVDRGHGRPRRDHRHQQRHGEGELRQGRGQGRAEGDVQDGHLDAGVLHRRAAVPGDRHQPAAARRVLHGSDVSGRRHRPRRHRRRRRARHALAYLDRPDEWAHRELEVGGEYQWRREGEYHLFNPDTVFKLQHSTRTGQYSIFKEYTATGRRPERADGLAARAAEVQGRCARTGAARRGRARRARSSSGSPPAR